eukprot:6857667-Alexandrium_andersonii.AAC.1
MVESDSQAGSIKPCCACKTYDGTAQCSVCLLVWHPQCCEKVLADAQAANSDAFELAQRPEAAVLPDAFI